VELQEKNNQFKQMQKELEQSRQCPLQLAQLKQELLSLSEVNTKLVGEVNTFRQQTTALSPQKWHIKVFTRPSGRDRLPSTVLSNEMVGWID
jgi:hypothetical protein